MPSSSVSGWRGVSASTDPRQRAAGVLARVDSAGAYAARLLGDAPPLTRELVLGTLRWQRTIDHLLTPYLHRSLSALDPQVRAVLRLGVYEAQRLSTPPPVAVAEAVRVAKATCRPAAALVNAVLRKAAHAAWPETADRSLALGLRLSHPDWMVERWRGLFGEALLVTALAADQEPAPLSVLAAGDTEQRLRAAGCELVPHPWSRAVRVVTGNAAAAVRIVAEGGGYALDPTAALVARLAPWVAGIRVLDLNAAPGGKLLVLDAHSEGLVLVGADRHLGRVVRLRRTLAARGSGAAVLVADATAPPFVSGRCGLVVVDAPCSGTGTLRRHPEIRWRLRAEDLPGLAAAQRRILAGAVGLVAPGGHLLYATCSLEPEENEQVVVGLALEPVPLASALPPGLAFVRRPSGGVVIPPSAWGDGFSVHLFRRLA